MFTLTYTLGENGWATASVRTPTAYVETDVSYLSDALGDLARACRGILKGMEETTFSFQQEPGEHRVIVSRENEAVRPAVHVFPEPFSRRMLGEPILVADCSLREFATECINCLRRVRDLHPGDGYRQQWTAHDFPEREYQDLLALRRDLPTSRDGAGTDSG